MSVAYLPVVHRLLSSVWPIDRYRRYDWWGAALGMDVGPASVILLAYNPEDAHLYKASLTRVSIEPAAS